MSFLSRLLRSFFFSFIYLFAFDGFTDFFHQILYRCEQARELLANAAEAGQDGAQAAIAQANELIQAAAPHVKQAVAASAEALGTTWKLACAGAGVAVAELGTAAALAAQVCAAPPSPPHRLGVILFHLCFNQ